MIERCLWTETSPLPGFPISSLPGRTDIAIVGGGYTGLSAARALARRGVDVTVLERHGIGWGASSRNGGFVLPGFKPEMEELAARLGADRAARMFRLSLEAMRNLATIISEEAIACDFRQSGAVTLAAKPSHLKALEVSGRFLREQLGYETELLSGAELQREIGSQRYHGGLVDPGACSLQPAKYVAGLAQAAERAGARLIEGAEVTRIRRVSGGFEVRTAQGTLRSREVLAATNGYTPAALGRLRRRVIPIGSYQIATNPLDEELAHRLIPRGRVFSDTKNLLYYFRLSPDGRMVFGGRASFTPASTRRSAEILGRGMREVFPELAPATVEYAWSGKVAYPIDHLPHAGRMDGIYYAIGYCGHGVALATYIGGRMGEVLAGTGEIPDLGTSRFRAIPLYTGVPWFLPLVGGYYRMKDRIS
ncbi:MAG TPA: FAD-dependent oxidoreductase [Gemmatimonadales bacterium]|nr:FAD-dependent oxidoreductase [Gemmatimonadales bacterium]